MKQFLYTKMSLPNDPPEATQNNVIIDGYVGDLTSENYEVSRTDGLHGNISIMIASFH